MNKVTEVLLQKGRREDCPFQVAALMLSVLFLSVYTSELAHVLGSRLLVLLLFPMFGSIYLAIFKAGSNSFGKTLRYCIIYLA